MGGTNNLYISEMLENLQANMEEAMGNLAMKMEGMAESMAESTAAMGEVVKNTSQIITSFKVVPSDNLKHNIDFPAISAKSGNVTVKRDLFTCFAEGSIRIKFKYRWNNTCQGASTFKFMCGETVMHQISVPSFNSVTAFSSVDVNVPVIPGEKIYFTLTSGGVHSSYPNDDCDIYFENDKLEVYFDKINVVESGPLVEI